MANYTTHTTNTTTLLRNPQKLSYSYFPDPVGRQAECNRLRTCLQPLTKNQPPQDCWLHGPVGTGKTTCARHVLNDLDQSAKIDTTYVNCKEHNSMQALLTEIVSGADLFTPRRGWSTDEKLQQLRSMLETNLVVALDEFDCLDNPGDVAYRLKTCADQHRQYLALVCLSTTPPDQVGMSNRGLSRLEYHGIEFEPYTKQELEEILTDRAQDAFCDGAVSPDALLLIADRVANQIETGRGDVRRALTLLRCAGQRAEREGASTVTEAHVESCFNLARG